MTATAPPVAAAVGAVSSPMTSAAVATPSSMVAIMGADEAAITFRTL